MKESDVTVKIKAKLLPTLTIIFAVISMTLIILQYFNNSNYSNNNIHMIFLGLMFVCSGLTQVSLVKQIDSKGVSRGSKPIGVFTIILGIVNIITFLL